MPARGASVRPGPGTVKRSPRNHRHDLRPVVPVPPDSVARPDRDVALCASDRFPSPRGPAMSRLDGDAATFCEHCGAHRDQLGDERTAPIRGCDSCERAICPNCWNLVADRCLRCVPFTIPGSGTSADRAPRRVAVERPTNVGTAAVRPASSTTRRPRSRPTRLARPLQADASRVAIAVMIVAMVGAAVAAGPSLLAAGRSGIAQDTTTGIPVVDPTLITDSAAAGSPDASTDTSGPAPGSSTDAPGRVDPDHRGSGSSGPRGAGATPTPGHGGTPTPTATPTASGAATPTPDPTHSPTPDPTPDPTPGSDAHPDARPDAHPDARSDPGSDPGSDPLTPTCIEQRHLDS